MNLEPSIKSNKTLFGTIVGCRIGKSRKLIQLRSISVSWEKSKLTIFQPHRAAEKMFTLILGNVSSAFESFLFPASSVLSRLGI